MRESVIRAWTTAAGFVCLVVVSAGVGAAEVGQAACVPADAVRAATADAARLLEQQDYQAALTRLESVDVGSVTKPCELYPAHALRVRALSATKQYAAALDVIDAMAASGEIPANELGSWTLQAATLKAQAQQEGLAKDREGKKRFKLTEPERAALAWQQFREGTYAFASRGLGSALLGVVGLTTLSFEDIEKADSLFQGREWEVLARYVMQSPAAQGLDIDYFYLAAAAFGLGLDDLARTYANKSIELTANGPKALRCVNRIITDGRRDLSYCGSHRLPAEANGLLTAIARKEADEARRVAEEVRQREEAAQREAQAARTAELQRRAAATAAKARDAQKQALAARFPAEWVDDILAHNVRKGMSKAAVSESLGKPGSIERIDTQEMWHYGTTRIVFTGDEVTFVDR